MATVTVYAPSPGQTDAPGSALESERPYRGLAGVLARGRRTGLPDVPCHEHLWALFSMPEQPSGRFPIAAVTRCAEGVEGTEKTWLRADPVHLYADLTALALFDSRAFSLTAQEADGLIAHLNADLAESGWLFRRGTDPFHWYVGLNESLDAATLSTTQTAGCDISQCMPEGRDARMLRQTMNDVQMLLHQAPVNQAREQRGEPPVNSVWFWGAGDEPVAASAAPWDFVFAGDALTCGLARLHNIDHALLPGTVAELMEVLEAQREILIAAVPESFAWQRNEQLKSLAEAIIPPVTRCLRQGRIPRAVIETGSFRYELRRWDALKFWRQIKPLKHYGL